MHCLLNAAHTPNFLNWESQQYNNMNTLSVGRDVSVNLHAYKSIKGQKNMDAMFIQFFQFNVHQVGNNESIKRVDYKNKDERSYKKWLF